MPARGLWPYPVLPWLVGLVGAQLGSSTLIVNGWRFGNLIEFQLGISFCVISIAAFFAAFFLLPRSARWKRRQDQQA